MRELDSLGWSAGGGHVLLNRYTGGKKARMAVYDLETVYTCISFDDLTDRMYKLIREVFDKRNQQVLHASGQPCLRLLQVGKSESRWVQSDERKWECEIGRQTADAASLVFDAIEVGGLCIHQGRPRLFCGKKKIGIAMGTDCGLRSQLTSTVEDI